LACACPNSPICVPQPCLVSGRKFDIRVFVLFNVNNRKSIDVYMYDEFYVRTSSVAYSLKKKDVADCQMHLTNDAVQNKSKKGKGQKSAYGQYEDANKLSMDEFGEYLKENCGCTENWIPDVLTKKLREMVKVSGASVREKLNPKQRKHGFEMMGYDFMLDEKLNPWLIEVNSNPCLEMPCQLLGE